MSRARDRRAAALLKRQVAEMPSEDDDESEWDDVSGHELDADEDSEGEQQ